MKPLMTATLALLLCPAAFAQPPMDDCEEIPELASLVMARRQVNYDVMLMINYMNAEFNDRPELMSWVQAMIDMAYIQPMPENPEARQKQLDDFVKLWQERCLGSKS